MPEGRRYLLGKAERLTRPIVVSKASGPKAHPYTFAKQKVRLASQAMRVAETVASLPDAACPEDRSVCVLTLHPAYFAKSYFPAELLRATNLKPLGSRPVAVDPDEGSPGMSTAVFIGGKRSAFADLAERVARPDSQNDDILTIENLRVPVPDEKFRFVNNGEGRVLEVILHAPAEWESIIEGFDGYLDLLGFEGDISRRHYVRDLCFMPVHVRGPDLKGLGLFSFLRVARTMPRLREIRPPTLARASPARHVELPGGPAIDQGVRAAIFDGGLDPRSPLSKWATAKDTAKLGPPVTKFVTHGTNVTSAALFGSLDADPPVPYANIDHFRVIDAQSYDPNGEYYDVLDRLVEVLGTTHYDFVNLSLGPNIPIEDDEVHPWTAKLDEMLSDGKTLLVSAVGNEGGADRAAGLARIQPPADGVNLLGVGAADVR
jgi:hypothetical protein